MQKALYISNAGGVEDLNDILKEGKWTVYTTCAMPSCGDPGNYPTCLVILTDLGERR